VISGRSANGRTVWIVEKTGQSYAVWQDQQLSQLGVEQAGNNINDLSSHIEMTGD
jgi:outer membrane lipoprotein-sorting protein